MNQTVIFFGVIISLIVFWLVGFVDSLNNEMEVNYKSSEDRTIFMQSNTDSLKKKKLLWSSSSIKAEMLELFPDFIKMRTFIEENIEDDAFKKELLRKIDDVELKYIGGSMDTQSAKSALSKF